MADAPVYLDESAISSMVGQYSTYNTTWTYSVITKTYKWKDIFKGHAYISEQMCCNK
jgi:hypothetical protein